MRRYVAEFVATFFLVFIGAGSVVADGYLSGVRVTDTFGLAGIAFAHGLALAVAIAAVAHVSGGHVNPAISFAFWIARRLSARDLLFYVVSQLLGGVAAAFLLKGLLPAAAFEFTGGGVTGLAQDVAVLDGIAIEVVLTFFLAFTIWGVAVDRRGPRAIAPLAIGLVLTFDILAGGAFTGGAMNPARWFGPALASGQFANAIVWTVGPILGALLGSLIYEYFILGEQPAAIQEVEEFEEEEEEEFEEARVPAARPAPSPPPPTSAPEPGRESPTYERPPEPPPAEPRREPPTHEPRPEPPPSGGYEPRPEPPSRPPGEGEE